MKLKKTLSILLGLIYIPGKLVLALYIGLTVAPYIIDFMIESTRFTISVLMQMPLEELNGDGGVVYLVLHFVLAIFIAGALANVNTGLETKLSDWFKEKHA